MKIFLIAVASLSRHRYTPQFFNLEGIGKVQGHAWHPIVRATAPTAKVIGTGEEGDVALHNKLGEGEVWWFAPSVSLSSFTRNNAADIVKLCEDLLNDKLEEQPFRFAGYADGAMMRVLRNGNEYVTVLTNNNFTPCTIKLIAPKGLEATTIFGEAKMNKSGKVTLGDRETLFLRWK